MQRRRKVPAHSSPAAFFAALRSPSIVGGESCASATAALAAKTNAIPTRIATNFIFIETPVPISVLFHVAAFAVVTDRPGRHRDDFAVCYHSGVVIPGIAVPPELFLMLVERLGDRVRKVVRCIVTNIDDMSRTHQIGRA